MCRLIHKNQMELAMENKWDLEKKGFTSVAYRDPAVPQAGA